MFKIKKIILIIFFSMSTSLVANAARWAEISIDGAMIYKGSSFDAPVIAYLKKGKRVKVSSKTYGPFYKIRIRKGLTGFISDIDVKIVSGKVSSKSKDRNNKGGQEKIDDITEEPETPYDSGKPIFATKYIGLTGGIINFSEEVFDQKVSSSMTSYGVKLSGPNILFDGPFIMDINLLVSFVPPSYYKGFSPNLTPTGLSIFLDTSLIFPMMTGSGGGWMIYLGAGPLLVYTSYKIQIGTTPFQLDDAKLGGNFMLGMALRLGRMVLKVEPKYIVEKSSYPSVMGSLQYGF